MPNNLTTDQIEDLTNQTWKALRLVDSLLARLETLNTNNQSDILQSENSYKFIQAKLQIESSYKCLESGYAKFYDIYQRQIKR